MKGHESHALAVCEQIPFTSPLAHTLFGVFFSFVDGIFISITLSGVPGTVLHFETQKHGNQKCPSPCPILGSFLVTLRHGEGGQGHLMHIELWSPKEVEPQTRA